MDNNKTFDYLWGDAYNWHSMYNEFIEEIDWLYNIEHIFELKTNILVFGYRVYGTYLEDQTWFINTVPINDDIVKMYKLSLDEITNNLPEQIIRRHSMNPPDEYLHPYLFIPKDKINCLRYEYESCDYDLPDREKFYLEDGYNKKQMAKIHSNIDLNFRMITGIELIYKKDTLEEQIELWNNWNRMGIYSRTMSDRVSVKLFNMTNEERHNNFINLFN
jgi:hypothetical protein